MLWLLSEQQQLLGSFSWQGSSALKLSHSSVPSQPGCTEQHHHKTHLELTPGRNPTTRSNNPVPLLIPTENNTRVAQGTSQPTASSAPACSFLGSVWFWGFSGAQGTAGRFRGTPTPCGGGNSPSHPPATMGKEISLLGCSGGRESTHGTGAQPGAGLAQKKKKKSFRVHIKTRCGHRKSPLKKEKKYKIASQPQMGICSSLGSKKKPSRGQG